MAKVEYRSSLRSKRLIKHAFAALLQVKPVKKITISDIITTADISRGTFYAHYHDAVSVMEHIVEEEKNALFSLMEQTNNMEKSAIPAHLIPRICKYLDNDREYYKMLVSSEMVMQAFSDELYRSFNEKMTQQMVALPGIGNEENAKMTLIFLGSGFKTVVTQWLQDNINLSLDEISDNLTALVSGSQSLVADFSFSK